MSGLRYTGLVTDLVKDLADHDFGAMSVWSERNKHMCRLLALGWTVLSDT